MSVARSGDADAAGAEGAEGDVDNVPGTNGSPPRRKRGRAKAGASGSPKTKAAKKEKAPSGSKREMVCPLCGLLGTIAAKKKYCGDCNVDIESMRKDSGNSVGKEIMQELEQAANVDDLRNVWQKWREVVGPACGLSRLGRFNWTNVKRWWETKKGSRREQEKVMKTQKEFIALMEGKGKSREWSLDEFKRRWNGGSGIPGWEADHCPDTHLPRVQCFGETKEVAFSENSHGETVEQSMQEKSTTSDRLRELVGSLSNGQPVNLRTDADLAAMATGKMNSMAQVSSSSAGTDFWQRHTGPGSMRSAGSPGSKAPSSAAGGSEIAPSPSPQQAKGGSGGGRPPFDPVTDCAEVRKPLRESVDAIKKDMSEAISSIDEVVSSVRNDKSGSYSDTFPHLDRRLTCVKKMMESEEHFQTYARGLTDPKELPFAEPIFKPLVSMVAMTALVDNLGSKALNWEELDKEVKACETKIDILKSALSATKRLSTVVLSIRTTREREAVNAEQERVKALHRAQAAAARAAATAAAAPAALTGDAARKAFYELDFRNHVSMRELANGMKNENWELPFVQPVSDVGSKVLNASPCRLNVMVFKAGFIKKKPPVKREHQAHSIRLRAPFLRPPPFQFPLGPTFYFRCFFLYV